MNKDQIAKEPRSGRLLSLDAYRGAVMMTLVSGPLILGVATRFDQHAFFGFLAGQFVHAPWAGCRFWDLIMPSFMLMVGLALPFSYASKVKRGEPRQRIVLHVLKRSVVFVVLGLLISSRGEPQTRFTFTGLLTQFGLAYPFAFLMVGRGLGRQALAVGLILVGYWFAFYLYPLPPEGFDFNSVGLPEDVSPFTGLYAHWNWGTNLATRFDVWFLNLFPRVEQYRYDPYGNQTLNFIPSIATMTLGVMAGELLRSPRPKPAKLIQLVASGAILAGIGLIAGIAVCPLVKSIWTPSWVLFSGGLTLLSMAGFFWAVEMMGWSKAILPLVIVGMNSLAIYLLNSFTFPWEQMIEVHIVSSWAAQQVLGVFILWLICFWMYRRRIFLRI